MKVVLVIIIFLPSFTLCIFFPLGNIRNFCRDYTLQSRFRTYILVCTFISPLKLKCITSHKELFSLRTAYLNSKDKRQDLSGKRAWEHTYPKSRKFLTFFIKRTFPLKFTHKTRTKGLFIESMHGKVVNFPLFTTKAFNREAQNRKKSSHLLLKRVYAHTKRGTSLIALR